VIERCIAALLTLMLATVGVAHGEPGAPTSTARNTILAQFASLPLRFEPGAAVAGTRSFVARGANYAVAVSARGVHLAFGPDGGAHAAIDLRFLGGNADAAVEGVGPRATRIHRLHHGDARDEVDVTAYARVALANLYPGIDVAFHGRGRDLEYDVIVAPGGDPARFAFRVDGSETVMRDDGGDLVIATSAGALALKRPVAWQDIDASRRFVASEFAVDANGVVRLRVGDYDRAHTLVIDPVVSYATYLGGNSFEQGTAIAVDPAGNAYVAGYTASSDFPLASALDRSIGKKGDVDVFVSKLNASGTGLIWSTYIGGSASTDRAVGIAVDAAGSVYITGQTSGSDFPTSANAWQKAITGGGGFVTKLASAGNAIAYSTYVAAATPSAIAVDATGNAYVTGSAGAAFITTPGSLQPATGNPAGSSAFVLKLDTRGAGAAFSTFLGGTGGEDATSIALDEHANVYIGGWTTSPDFPVRNAFQAAPGAGKDAFVAKLRSDGSQLVYSTRLGGALDDAVNAIAVDSAGNAYVAGETYSSDFPVTNGFQMRKAGDRLINSSVGNAFVAKLAPGGNALVYASFLGGEVCETLCQLVFGPLPQFRGDAAYGIAVDATGHAYVTGIARSYTFPLVDSAGPRKQEDNEDSAFVAKVSISGSSLLWSTFLRTGFGEADNKWTRFPPGAATAVAVDAGGNAYVTGDSDSASNFHTTQGAFQTTSTFGPAATIVKFPAAPAMALTTSNPTSDTQTPVTLTATLSGPAVSGTVTFRAGASWIGSGPLVANQASITLTLPAGIHWLNAVLQLPGSISDTASVVEVIDVPLVCD